MQVAEAPVAEPAGDAGADSGMTWVAEYDYAAADADEVTVAEGDVVINVSIVGEGWITVRARRQPIDSAPPPPPPPSFAWTARLAAERRVACACSVCAPCCCMLLDGAVCWMVLDGRGSAVDGGVVLVDLWPASCGLHRAACAVPVPTVCRARSSARGRAA